MKIYTCCLGAVLLFSGNVCAAEEPPVLIENEIENEEDFKGIASNTSNSLQNDISLGSAVSLNERENILLDGANGDDKFTIDGQNKASLRTFSSGGKTRITGIDNDIRSYKDQTLGRMEIGGAFGFTRDFSGYAAAGYTFGDDYKAYDINVGVSYAF